MARNAPSRVAPPNAANLRSRVDAAIAEGRQPQAFDLAKKLVAQEPTDAHRQLLRRICLDAIRYQIGRDSLADARRWLDEAERIDGPADWWEALALHRAAIGDCDRARQLLAKAPGSAMLPRVLGFQVDRAMADRQRGRDLVPAELRGEFDLVRKAFAEYEKGQDEAARQAVQSIGLQSPFLDWKLLLRGMLAWTANDDSRALDNWQRLDPQRLPARLAAPFRLQIEPAYRNALPPDEAKRIGRRADQISHPMLNALRDLQKLLATPETLHRALSNVPAVLGLMRMNFPQLAAKLANCFYWLIVQGGQPDDLDRYEKLFGKPPEDPDFFRMLALITELLPSFDQAHLYWKEYIAWIEGTPQRWPSEQSARARAMIFQRMGDNACRHLESQEAPSSFMDFLKMFDEDGLGPRKQSLQPTAETCYRRAMELAPDWKEPAARLMDLLAENEKWPQAEAVGRKLLKQFPDDVETLVAVSSIQQQLGKTDEALANLRGALSANPLDRKLRSGVAALTLEHGRMLASAKQFEQARAAFEQAEACGEEMLRTIAKAARAACEFKAKNLERANELVAAAAAPPTLQLAMSYAMVVESSRIKVDKAALKQLQTRFDEAFNTVDTLGGHVDLLLVLSFYQRETHRYRGIGPHEKKILARTEQFIRTTTVGEEGLKQLGLVLWRCRQLKPLKLCAETGMSRFPGNPHFRFFLAEQLIMQRPRSFPIRQVGHLFQETLRLTEGAQDEDSRMLRAQIEERKKEHPAIESWMTPAGYW